MKRLKVQSNNDIASKSIKDEYANGAVCLADVIRQHVAFCLQFDFDQILQSDKIVVSCLECGKLIKVKVDELSTKLFCDECKDVQITKAHIDRLNARVSDISNKLLNTI